MLSTTVINTRSPVTFSEEIRGRRHFNQAHRRTSLFGSENEPQCFEEHTKNPVNGSYVLHNGMNNGRETLKIHQNHNENEVDRLVGERSSQDIRKAPIENHTIDNKYSICNGNRSREEPVNGSKVEKNGEANNYRKDESLDSNFHEGYNENLKDTSGVEHLIQAAKERARKRELDRYKVDEDSFLLETPEKPKSSKEQKRGMINAPWHTDPDEGIGSEKYQRRNGRIADEAPNVQRLKSRSQSITQQDFPRYSAQELKECRQKVSYYGNKESMEWSFNQQDDANNGTDENGSNYHKSSAVIGQGFIDRYGLKTPSLYKKKNDDIPVSASALRNSPYAFHG
uniref:Uncharacterized protein n=2 Tax=Trichobilharzia regenti TaxID=157069 RepID=A0AA85IUS4_TRIRE|nr:unnamed protein product [Trichobilharzia regenti]